MATIPASLQACGVGNPPSWRIRDSHIEHFALADQIIETPHDFLYGRHLVPYVDPIQVDIVRPQTLQTWFEGLHHISPVIASRIRVFPWSRIGVFRRHHHLLVQPSILDLDALFHGYFFVQRRSAF